jgi:hypothetical protein
MMVLWSANQTQANPNPYLFKKPYKIDIRIFKFVRLYHLAGAFHQFKIFFNLRLAAVRALVRAYEIKRRFFRRRWPQYLYSEYFLNRS